MNSTTKSVEEMRILKEMGDGLLNRQYHIKSLLLTADKPKLLSEPEFLVVRTKLEKKFPATIEFNKVRQLRYFLSLYMVF